jgi:hypothetical protein
LYPDARRQNSPEETTSLINVSPSGLPADICTRTTDVTGSEHAKSAYRHALNAYRRIFTPPRRSAECDDGIHAIQFWTACP